MTRKNASILSDDLRDKRAKISLKKIVNGLKKRKSKPGNVRLGKLRILTIDGGGIRAIVPAVLLARLEEKLQIDSGNPQASIVDYFDLFAGTSAGGILCSLYLTPHPSKPLRPKYTAREVLQLYLQDGCESFTPANPDASGRRSEKYSAAILEEKLKFLLGTDTKLEELLKPTLITAYNTETEAPVFFKSWQSTGAKIWQVSRATSAAPGMFKPAQYEGLEQGQTLIDGSIFAGNPAMCAFALASNTQFSSLAGCSYFKDRPAIEDMLIFSVGTGKTPVRSEKKNESWIRLMMKSQLSSGPKLVDRQLRHLFSQHREGSYFRFNPDLILDGTTIDNVGEEHVDTLFQLGSNYFKERSESIDQLLAALQSEAIH